MTKFDRETLEAGFRVLKSECLGYLEEQFRGHIEALTTERDLYRAQLEAAPATYDVYETVSHGYSGTTTECSEEYRDWYDKTQKLLGDK